MAKKIIRLTESDLHRIISKSVNRIINEISLDSKDANQELDNNMEVIVVGGDKEGTYKVGELENYFEIKGYVEPSKNPIFKNSKLIGLPILKGYVGPMGPDGGKIFYETQEAYDFFST